ncbi:GGDEF domain-containing protein [Vibrio sp. SCSIO 43136]|nr:GGDEF domain-containing protein [Vibrio sp. SCSIO 43136]USD67269.1 GGDEF domain-containing protein [Vibrio sp. SCSIO 43136]
MINYSVSAAVFIPLAQLFTAGVCVAMFIRLRKGKPINHHCLVMAIVASMPILYGVFQYQAESGIVSWIFILPVFYYVLVNRLQATLLTALACGCVSYAYGLEQIRNHQFPFMMLNFLSAYGLIWVVVHLQENIRVKIENHLANLALTDALTGAYNRLALQKSVTKRSNNGREYIFHFDIDFFKKVNDQYGHSIGDNILVELCKAVTLVGFNGELYRIGGEEFCLVFTAKDKQSAYQKTQKILSAVEQTAIDVEGQSISVTISGGLIHYRIDEHLDSALRRSDSALYCAKENGRNQVVWSESPMRRWTDRNARSEQHSHLGLPR